MSSDLGDETMVLAQLKNVFRFFEGSEMPSGEEKEQLIKEVLLMVLARATSSDSNIDNLEVETVQNIFKARTGEEVSTKDVRVAALSELYESAPLPRYLSKMSGKLGQDDCIMIVESLAEVIKTDGEVRPTEIEFFNSVVKAMGLSSAQVAGLE
ncbi:TerB family tellurite resistance protein [Kordiimonas sp. SCSIO 12610]|uniref:TerB family tellurite resistance protein n=1 Tax=Kordiimonas sp. SCSIO 12610 TaxID=2829597 RepID=UPI00210AF024|nr:TerB family tellurite resistance protein [Kordiimonas sp. SCSIO 12610]UTW55643.1 TerB family tellurite resistance protein [Kordiimonas sp. SCSIO 12610]